MQALVSSYRTHTCAQLRPSDVGTEVTISGWIMRKRDHGGVVFIDLRDNYGVTQVVFSDLHREMVQALRTESVVTVAGRVVLRSADTVNAKLPTGEIEVSCASLDIQSTSEVLPFLIDEDDHAPEATRLKYRFLELRREKLHQNILLRSRVIQKMRDTMLGMGFNEFQTPILTSSSPEGARDFIVPSRLHPGKFFALPQAPQQFKQLLMISGFDRYFQIAPCFRDEDARADRSAGEFYQIDIECSFVEQDDILTICEHLLTTIFGTFAEASKITSAPFPRIKYLDALSSYGTDKPDLRNPLRIHDVSSVFAASQFKVFKGALEKGGKIKTIALSVKDFPSRKFFDDTIEYFKGLSGQGLAYINIDETGPKGVIAKFVSPEEIEALKKAVPVEGNAIYFFAAGDDRIISGPLGKLRLKLGQDFNLVEKDAYRFCWVTDMPFYEIGTESGKLEFGHNPFSMPQGGLEALNTKNPLEIFAWQYDTVCNGYEISSGAIRNHKPEVMYRAFEIAGYSRQQVDDKFGGMIRAFKFGAPPHGGVAYGIDRIVMLLAGEDAIREVIAFPLTQNAEDLLMSAPSSVSDRQLKEAHIEVKLPEEQKKIAAGA